MLDPKGLYTIYRYDRSNGRTGGGVCVLVKACQNAVHVDLQPSYASFECVCFDLFISCSVIRMFVIYRPPSTSQVSDAPCMNELINCLVMHSVNTSTTCILGDLNCPNIYWDASFVLSDAAQKKFYDFTTDHGLFQFVTSPTRGSNILDIVLCNDPLFVTDVKTAAPFSNSDHNSVYCVFNISISKSAARSSCYNRCATVKTCNSFKRNVILWTKANWSQLEIFYNQLNWDTYCFNM